MSLSELDDKSQYALRTKTFNPKVMKFKVPNCKKMLKINCLDKDRKRSEKVSIEISERLLERDESLDSSKFLNTIFIGRESNTLRILQGQGEAVDRSYNSSVVELMSIHEDDGN